MKIFTHTNTFVKCENTSFFITFETRKLHTIALLSSDVFRWILFGYWININYFISCLKKNWFICSNFSFSWRFPGMVEVLKNDWISSYYNCRYWMQLPQHRIWHFLPRFINFSSKWWIHMTEWAVGNQSLRFTK